MEIVSRLKKAQRDAHRVSYSNNVINDNSKSFLHIDNTHSWARNYALHSLSPYFETFSEGTALTIGDGKGAHEAQILKRLGFNSTASDLSVEMLKIAQEDGLIDNYLEIDAESMDLEDESFDLSIIKETLHHLPRPYLCIYEMLRISKHSCIFIEPNGDHCYRVGNEQYEISGNYKYQFTKKEIIQTAVCLGLTNIAIGYVPNVNYILNCYCYPLLEPDIWRDKDTRPPVSELSGRLSPITIKYNEQFNDIRGDYQQAVDRWYYDHNKEINPLITFVISKEPFSYEERVALETADFDILNLKRNPYV